MVNASLEAAIRRAQAQGGVEANDVLKLVDKVWPADKWARDFENMTSHLRKRWW